MNRKKHECTCEFAWDHHFEKIFSLFDFDETVQDIAHQFKYKGKKSLAFFLGKEYSHFIPDDYFAAIDAVLSVPLHFLRKLERGYNQAEYFAKGIVNATDLNLPYLNNVLIRSKHTKTQTKLNRDERHSC
jgi:predicted amidophosphoribosyltransferase